MTAAGYPPGAVGRRTAVLSGVRVGDGPGCELMR